MFISITHNQSGESLLLRRLAPNESVDPRHHVAKWAEMEGVTIAATQTGHIPCGCADYYAETRHTKEPSAVCWDSFDFYLED